MFEPEFWGLCYAVVRNQSDPCKLALLSSGENSNIFLTLTRVAQMVKSLPAVQETQVRSLGQEDPLEKGMATHSSILSRSIPWTEEPGGLQSMGLQSWTQMSN